MKRLAAPKSRPILRKAFVWTVKGKCGPHNRQSSIPLGLVLRDLLKYARNKKEVKFILNQAKVKVDGVIRKDYKFPVGLFDALDFEERKERFRVVFDGKGRLALIKANPKEKLKKICKITGKRAIPKGLIQLQLNDGKVLLEKKTDLSLGDTVLLSLPEQKVLESVKLEKQALVYLIAGKHVGERAKITKVFPGTMRRERLLTLTEKGKKFQTTEKNLIVIGKEKPLIEMESVE